MSALNELEIHQNAFATVAPPVCEFTALPRLADPLAGRVGPLYFQPLYTQVTQHELEVLHESFAVSRRKCWTTSFIQHQ
jgi:hypothetical protein